MPKLFSLSEVIFKLRCVSLNITHLVKVYNKTNLPYHQKGIEHLHIITIIKLFPSGWKKSVLSTKTDLH